MIKNLLFNVTRAHAYFKNAINDFSSFSAWNHFGKNWKKHSYIICISLVDIFRRNDFVFVFARFSNLYVTDA